MSESIQRLEEKIAHLEHHVTAQDKAMFEFGEELARLRREMKRLADRLSAAGTSASDEPDAEPERPPHY